MYPQYHNYDREPEISVKGYESEAFSGYEAIACRLKKEISGKKKCIAVMEIYPGVNEEELITALSSLFDTCISAESCMVSREVYAKRIAADLTDDRVFGKMSRALLEDFFPPEKRAALAEQLNNIESGTVLLYGTGASLITEGDILIYCDIARWEIQTRFKAGMSNFHCDNSDAPFLAKFKQGYFIEWRMADRRKAALFDSIDFVIDTNKPSEPAMISGNAFRAALNTASRRPFRLVPYFDPGVWGGQWMKEVCGLPKDAKNYAWSFDGVPEENSLYFRFGATRVELPAMDLVLYRPITLLGQRVYDRFGAEFPIRFDFLDTMDGQNLSLQVHPIPEYIHQTFGMAYTQDESYYILDCEEDACVYLGLKTGIDPEEMLNALKEAQKGGPAFDAEKYVNRFPAKKHDHFLIPAGTVHCSGANSMVLEISATPYIFTFKLWDWGRLGLDGLPRPIHIEHGSKVIQWNRDTEWVKDNLVDRAETLYDADYKEERTGLHSLEFIETRRHTFKSAVLHHTNGSVHMLNLVEGQEAEVFSPSGAFEPFTVHYAETFIIPASIAEYGIRPTALSRGQTLMTIQASVRE